METQRVTRGQRRLATETVIIGTIGMHLADDSQWERRSTFTQPRNWTESIQYVQDMSQ